MATRRLGIIMHGATSRIGTSQHLLNSLVPIRQEGGLQLIEACHESHRSRRWVDLPALEG